MKKVEVVTDSLHARRILELFEREGVTGYTVIRDAIGKGERGIMTADELTDVFKNSYIFTVCSDDVAEKIADKIEQLLERYGGICIISDVQAIGIK